MAEADALEAFLDVINAQTKTTRKKAAQKKSAAKRKPAKKSAARRKKS